MPSPYQFQSVSTNLNVVAKTGTYQITNADNVISYDCSGGSFTTTLPTAVGIAGKSFTLVRTNQTASVAVTVATTSSQTMGGLASGNLGLDIQREAVTLISDGANWQIVSWFIPRIEYTVAVSGTNWTTSRSRAVITKTPSSTPVWYAAMNVGGTLSVSSANIVLTFTGLAFATGGPNNRQSIYCSDDSFGFASSNPFAFGATWNVNFAAATNATTAGATLELAAKPTFAM